MKVLFAVSNEEISESIVKKYQKEYKQIISYKNVYYFNAILKELQKDKSYDRVVISEDLEAFTHTQYDQIDKFIFEKLDSISDEASNLSGSDIPIILICSDRRTQSEEMLVKLFGIGIYNAIIGNDRSVDEVCKLINRPRSKKDAKNYYRIESEDINYQSENENDVSEVEIQNILAHYKRLGKNEDRYIDSFNNIAEQYNDTQLRIISKFLPLNVRAVLEEKSPKYQQIMSFNNSVSDKLRKPKKEENGTSEKLLTLKNKQQIIGKQIVIPASVDLNSNKKLARIKHPIQQQQHFVEEQPIKTHNIDTYIPQPQQPKTEIASINEVKDETINVVENNDKENEKVNEEKIVKRGRGRPRKNPIQEESTDKVKRGRGRPRKKPINVEEQDYILPGMIENKKDDEKEEMILPGLNYKESNEEESFEDILPGLSKIQQNNDNDIEDENDILPGLKKLDDDYDTVDYYTQAQQVNRNEYKKGDNNLETQTQMQYRYNNVNQNEYQETESVPEVPLEQYEYNNEYKKNDNISTHQQYGYNNLNTTIYQRNNNSSNLEYQQKQQTEHELYKEDKNIETIDLSYLLTPDRKIATFVGTSKNGTSFIVNNLAELISSYGVNTAILDTTKNRNSYYIYTKNEENLRVIASNSIDGLANGVANGVQVNKNLTVYTSLPNEGESIKNVDKILETLLKQHSLILIDADFDTPNGYFKQSQELYLIQTLDILTIQPLTAFLRELKAKNILDEKKLRIIINKNVKIRGISEKTIIGGMAYYNDPAMSFMTELFDRNIIKYFTIPFENETYTKYLENIIECNISLKGYSKFFLQALQNLSNMVYSLPNTYRPQTQGNRIVNNTTFSPNMNNTLNQMKNNY